MFKIFKFFFTIFFFVAIIGIFIVFFVFRRVSLSVGKPQNYIVETLLSLNKDHPYQNKEKINFIVLGLDKRDDELEKTQTTDTIMFVSLNLKSQKINLISIPRDLYFYKINSKINEIYPLSLEQETPFSYIRDNYQSLINQSIDNVVILTTDNLIKFVNLIGGVDIYLEKGFVDDQYPSQEYIDNPSLNLPKYKTVEFKAGLNHLDQTNISEFVRSRKSSDSLENGGTDLARIQRQQLLLETLLNKIKSGDFISKNLNFVDLYKFWDQEIIKDISDQEALNIAIALNKNINKLTLNKITLPLGTNSKDGVYYHPKTFINKQWVFIPSDKDYQSIQQFISDSI